MVSLFWKDQRLKDRFLIFENDTGALRCEIKANPPVHSPIEWYRDDRLLTDETDPELRLTGANVQSLHQLTCRAKNALGQSDAQVQLEFRCKTRRHSSDPLLSFHSIRIDKPRLSMIDSLFIPEGHAGILHCSINSHPRCSQVRWFFAETLLLLSQPCPIYNATHTFVEYRLENVSRHQAGKYSCEVTNGNGDDAKSIVSTHLHVQCKMKRTACEREVSDGLI